MIEIALDDFVKIEDQKEAKKVLKELATKNSDRVIAEHWGIPISKFRKLRADMGIKKRAGNGRKMKIETKTVSAGNLDYNISIEGKLTGEMLHERLDELKSLVAAMPAETFEVKIHSAHS